MSDRFDLMYAHGISRIEKYLLMCTVHTINTKMHEFTCLGTKENVSYILHMLIFSRLYFTVGCSDFNISTSRIVEKVQKKFLALFIKKNFKIFCFIALGF